MEKVTLFYVEKPDIKISMEIYFNEKDQLIDFGTDIEPVIQSGEAFMTSGCYGHDGNVACNRPYGNERPSKPIRNYAYHPTSSDIETIREQLFDSLKLVEKI